MIQSLYAKIAVILIVTVLVPLGLSVYLVVKAVDTTLSLGVNAAIANQLEQGLEHARLYVEEVKRSSRQSFERILDSHQLHQMAQDSEPAELHGFLTDLLTSHPALISIRLQGPEVEPFIVARADVDGREMRRLSWSREVALGAYHQIDVEYGVEPELLQTFETAAVEYQTYKALIDAPPSYLEHRFLGVYLAILVLAMIASVFVGMLWARIQVTRIHRLGEATARVAAGDLDVRIDPGPIDEVGSLVRSFNSMVGELQDNRVRIEYLQKIGAWQDIARRLAHEIKNPLTPIQLAAQQLRQKYRDGSPQFEQLLEQTTEIIEEEVAALRRLTSDFSSFAKLPDVHPEMVSVGIFLDECAASLEPLAEQAEVVLRFDIGDRSMEIPVDRMLLKRVIDNLVRNAVQALTLGDATAPEVVVASHLAVEGATQEMVITVSDNGPGIPKAERKAIFDPYYTTKEDGTGLGLAIVKKIVFEHGGRIWVERAGHKGGARFSIALPLTETELKRKTWTLIERS